MHTLGAAPLLLEHRIANLVANQYGVVARWQLLNVGLGVDAIKHRLKTRRFVRIYPGVYAVGHAELTLRGRFMAAVLAGGPGAMLSHQSAGHLWEIALTSSGLIHVTTLTRKRRRLGNIVFHRAREVHPRDRTIKDRIPVTSVHRTLLDLAESVSVHQLRRALEQSVRLGIFDLRAMHELLDRSNGRHGLNPLVALLSTSTDHPPELRSGNEHAFRELCMDHGIPTPSFNVVVCGHLVDAHWPTQRGDPGAVAANVLRGLRARRR